uniref:Uncharacterized protein n=1 Tax=Chromulina nebulosa TaxID=96789 RepID=A0A7S0SUL3_9STRA|mmetsp:Transcript_3114/g.2756  ORF Transcript_3114/g.2756 Transcript_3114/m.2756 type:complete len:316 (+) Transcript_3114:3-950(+)
MFDGFMRSNGDGYVLLQYLPIVAGATHILTANDSSSNPKIAYPHKEKEIYFKLSQNNNIIRNLIDGVITSSIRDCNYHIIPHMNNNSIYSLDILPYLMGSLNPKFRSNNTSSFNSYEKTLIQNISDMMLSYTLTYQTNYQFNQSSNIQLDPPIDKVTCYELVDQVDIDRQIVRSTNIISNDIKIYIQSEMKKMKIQKEIEKIKALGVKAKNEILSPNRSAIKLKTKTPDSQMKSTSSPIVEIVESSKSNGKVDSFFTKKRKLPNDLIPNQLPDNVINNSTINQSQSKSNVKPLFYKYNQGFSNAVRRPVNIKEFM